MRAAEKYAGQLAPHYHGADEEEPVFRKTQARMFRTAFMEFFSKVHPVIPAVLYVPMVLWFGWLGWQSQGVLSFVGSFIGGLLTWTLAEYLLHRFVFHISLRGPVSKFLYFYSHGIHHQYPDDYYRLVMVPPVSIPLAVIFYFAFHLPLPAPVAHAAFSAFALGYLGYDYIHFATHHVRPPRAKVLAPVAHLFRVARKRHMLHHFDNHARGYGVSASLWDHVFGTHDPRSTDVRAASEQEAPVRGATDQ